MNYASSLVAKGAKLLDERSCGSKTCKTDHGSTTRPIVGNWRDLIKAKGEELYLGNAEDCVLGTLFKDKRALYESSYSTGLEALGLESGCAHGFDCSDNASYASLKEEWLKYVGFQPEIGYLVGDKLYGRHYSGAALRLDKVVYVGGIMYFAARQGDYSYGEFSFPEDRKHDLFTADELTKDYKRPPKFAAKEGDLITADDKVWYVGAGNRAWILSNGAPATYVALDTLVQKYSNLMHQQTGSGDNLVGYQS